MNFLPDAVRCQMARVYYGSFEVYPTIADRIPFEKITSQRIRMAVMPSLIIGPWILAFNYPKTMFLLAPAWMLLAWYIGYCPHCITSQEQEELREEHEEPHEDAVA